VLRLETRLALASQVLDWRWDSLAGDALRLFRCVISLGLTAHRNGWTVGC